MELLQVALRSLEHVRLLDASVTTNSSACVAAASKWGRRCIPSATLGRCVCFHMMLYTAYESTPYYRRRITSHSSTMSCPQITLEAPALKLQVDSWQPADVCFPRPLGQPGTLLHHHAPLAFLGQGLSEPRLPRCYSWHHTRCPCAICGAQVGELQPGPQSAEHSVGEGRSTGCEHGFKFSLTQRC